ncbi:MAG: hypothetical protein OXF11_00440 [Deltaproteobacteria bacterium]|nr:hypothetical protein [Deltaproteobacteria bacterium]
MNLLSPGMGVTLSFTPQMEKRLTRRAARMIEQSVRQFPELRNMKIHVGHTKAKLGVAFIPRAFRPPLYIRLRVRGLTHNTIGHELTHLLQGLTKLPPPEGVSAWEPVPIGETQCDIWTLARSDLFCDDAPTYLRMPRAVRENWRDYARRVRSLCVEAIRQRPVRRTYIRWLESQIAELPERAPVARADAPEQLWLAL